MHPSEAALVRQDLAWDGHLGQPATPPGTHVEQQAIETLDHDRREARFELRPGPTRKVRL